LVIQNSQQSCHQPVIEELLLLSKGMTTEPLHTVQSGISKKLLLACSLRINGEPAPHWLPSVALPVFRRELLGWF